MGLIAVLSSNADVILVDEVLDGMDLLNKRRIIEYLLDAREDGASVFISSHELNDLSGICDSIYYLGKDGRLIETRADKNKSIHKIQVVVKDKLPELMEDKAIIVSNLGRVYTILIDMASDKLDELLADDQIVQYDRLEVKVEDYFYLEEGARK